MTLIDTGIIVIYLIITLIVGFRNKLRATNFTEYTMGSKDFHLFVLLATLCATRLGGNSSIGTVADVYAKGFWFFSFIVAFLMKDLVKAFILGPKMDKFLGMMTVGEMMGSVYGKQARILTCIVGITISIGVLAAQIKTLNIIIEYFFNIQSSAITIATVVIVILYSAFGGLKAVVYTDVIQLIIFALAVPMISNFAISTVGGWNNIINHLPPGHYNITFSDPNFPKYFSMFLVTCFPSLIPSTVHRMLIAKNSGQIKSMFILSSVFNFCFFPIMAFIGLAAVVYNSNIAPNFALLYVMNEVLPIGIKGFAVAGMLAMVMSTADSLINTTSTMFVHDVLSQFKKDITDKAKVRSAIILSIIMSIGAVYMSFKFDSLLDLVFFSHSFWAAVVIFPLIFCIMDIKISTFSFYIAGIVGIITVILWQVFGIEKSTGLITMFGAMFANLTMLGLLKMLRK